MNYVHDISFILENCEVLTIGWEHIVHFRSSPIKTLEHYSSDRTFFHLSHGEKAAPVTNDEAFYSYPNDAKTRIQRISQYQDIVWIELRFRDATKKKIYMKWKGDSEYANEAQFSTIVPETGDILVAIAPKEEAEEYFRSRLSKEEK